ncbi:hypothetical protein EV424DRAFT_1355061, partial [Suillus variegatus]
MISDEYWTTYHEKLAESDLHTHATSFIPWDWALNAIDIASKWVEQQFAVHVAGRLLVPTPLELDPETALACGHLAFVLVEAYQHPNVVKLDIDIIRYNEALAKWESGLNDAREEALLAKFPPAECMFLDSPSVVIDAGYQIILWYLMGALNWSLQVGGDLFKDDMTLTKAHKRDMFIATVGMGDLLRKSITTRNESTGRTSKWWTNNSNFRAAMEPDLIPGCINISPCWFQQGRE